MKKIIFIGVVAVSALGIAMTVAQKRDNVAKMMSRVANLMFVHSVKTVDVDGSNMVYRVVFEDGEIRSYSFGKRR